MSDLLAPEHSVAYRTKQLVGRRDCKEKIRQAVDNEVRIVYIEAESGIGKTRLLEGVRDFVPQDSIVDTEVCSLVDFYDTEMHSDIALCEALTHRLRDNVEAESESDAFKEAWDDFHNAVDNYRLRAKRRGDWEPVYDAFRDLFNIWSEEKWIVLCFDTVEFLEYGQDDPQVIADCEIEGEEAPVLRWFEECLPELDRVTAILAARPTRTGDLRRKIESLYQPGFLSLNLDTFSLDATREFFRSSEYGKKVQDSDMIERLHLLTDGRPILLSLAVDWLNRSYPMPEIYDLDLDEMYRMKEEEENKWNLHRQRFERALVTIITELDVPDDIATCYAARMRKGFNPEMLCQVLEEFAPDPQKIDLTHEGMREIEDRLSQLSFVKAPPGRPDRLFLHEEMYDLLDRYVWTGGFLAHSKEEVAEYIAEEVYGDEKGRGLIGETARKVRSVFEEDIGYREWHAAQRQLNLLHTERLFYRLEVDPLDGYQLYQKLDNRSLVEKDTEWDDMLRIEVLRFIRKFEPDASFDRDTQRIKLFVNKGCRIRWLWRFSVRGDSKKADEVAQSLLAKYTQWGDLWKAGVMVARGAALQRLGDSGSIEILRRSRELLHGIPRVEFSEWAVNHCEATSYLYQALRERAEGKVQKAKESNVHAKNLFSLMSDELGRARVANNLAYVLARQGKYTEALELVQDDALETRLERGDVVGAALSYNTKAIAFDLKGDSLNAYDEAEKAIRLLIGMEREGFTELNREMALVYLNLGRIQRHITEDDALYEDRAVVSEKWREVERFLEQAEVRATASGLEPYYMLDINNQFGLLYTAWAVWVKSSNLPGGGDRYYRYRDLIESAHRCFREVDERYRDNLYLKLSVADNLEDWARLFYHRLRLETLHDGVRSALMKEGLDRLDRAEKLVDELITRRMSESVPFDLETSGSPAYYVAGCINQRRAHYLQIRGGEREAILRKCLLAAAYFYTFSTDRVARRQRVLDRARIILPDLPGARGMSEEYIQQLGERNLRTKELEEWLRSVPVRR